MEISDLIFLLLIGLGGISSLKGNKKKRSDGRNLPKSVKREERPASPRPTSTLSAPRRVPSTLSQSPDPMAAILQQLGLVPAEPDVPALSAEEPIDEFSESRTIEEVPVTSVIRSAPTALQIPKGTDAVPVSMLKSAFDRGDLASQRSPSRPPSANNSKRHREVRVRTLLSPKNVREAILLKAVLGPPKSLEP